MDITSLQNPRVKHIVRLRDDKRQRREAGVMLGVFGIYSTWTVMAGLRQTDRAATPHAADTLGADPVGRAGRAEDADYSAAPRRLEEWV